MDHNKSARIAPGGDMTSHVYEVIVRGRMSPELMASFAGFEIDTGTDGLTRLVGDVPDQSELLGLLAAFDDLHIEVVSVNPVSHQD
jgi:hypothetical protein